MEDVMRLDEIKTGDFLYYTERAYGDNYADSLIHIRKVDGVDFAHPIAVNFGGGYINEREDWGEDLPVASFFDQSCWFPTNYTDKEGDPSEWMQVNYPLQPIT